MRKWITTEGGRERTIGEKGGQGREGEKKEKKERESKTDGGKERGEEGRQIEEGREREKPVDDRVAFVAEKEVEFGGPTTLVPSDTRSIQTQLRGDKGEREEGQGREGGGDKGEREEGGGDKSTAIQDMLV